MGLLGKLFKTGIHIVTIPLAVAEDVITLGGALTDTDPAIAKKARQLKRDTEEVVNEVDRLGD